MQTRVTLKRPDDWHLHLRDGELLRAVLPASAAHFARALVMPNLLPPVVTADDAQVYRQQILQALPVESQFEPLMTLYLTESTQPEDVEHAYSMGLIRAVKLYPAGATTNSDSGVTNLSRVMVVLEKMAEIGLPLCVHGEVTDPDIDIFDREAVFIERVLEPLRRQVPALRVVMEHLTTAEGIDYVAQNDESLAATITTHHLMINRNHIFAGGIRPHYYCLPIAKREHHRLALRRAAVSGNSSFFLGTDSAPHLDDAKESACGCAGVFNAPNTLSCLAHVFEEESALDMLEGFASIHGPDFYGLPVNADSITLEKRAVPLPVAEKLQTPAGPLTVFDPGHPLYWHLA